MKQKKKLGMVISFGFIGLLAGIGTANAVLRFDSEVQAKEEQPLLTDFIEEHQTEIVQVVSENIEQQKQSEIVYDGLTLEELTAKLNRVLKSTLSGTGNSFATYSLESGVDPYIAVAIVLEETGCNSGTCSRLVRECNNVGGMKGTNTCGKSAYAGFSSLDEGIKQFISNLSRNYFASGLTTPELINTKYASSKTWATKVNRYIEKIRAS